MKITVLKEGILDTIQDMGRFGFQQYGINPGGAMDIYAMQAANFLTGNERNAAVIELHFPAAAFLFDEPALFSITGGDFSATLNEEKIPLWHPVHAKKNDVLQFHIPVSGARCYLAIHGSVPGDEWLGSCSTNLKVVKGGFKGRPLQKGDVIDSSVRFLLKTPMRVLPWRAGRAIEKKELTLLRFLPGPEWEWLDEIGRQQFTQTSFRIGNESDRMGYRLDGLGISSGRKEELVSSAVTFGTVQLLPGGMPLVLMADHQTTGGYPRIAQVISCDLHLLAQSRPGDHIMFKMIDQSLAEKLLFDQHTELQLMQNACIFRLEQFLQSNGRP
jgi:antagonist of KipI